MRLTYMNIIIILLLLINCKSKSEENYLIKIGKTKLPKFECYDLEGNKEIISHRNGEILILNFWDINCTPCINEIPGFNKLVKKYEKNKMIRFIALTSYYTKLEKLKIFFEENQFNFEQKLVKNNVLKLFNIKPMPTTIICNQKGKIVYYIIGGGPEIYKYIDKIINTLLNGGILCNIYN